MALVVDLIGERSRDVICRGDAYLNHLNSSIHRQRKLHKLIIPIQPIVSFCGSPTSQLSKCLTTVLRPLTNECRHKLQSIENFIDAIKIVQICYDYELLECVVTLDDNKKPTHTDRLLHYSSYNPTSHKATPDYTDLDKASATGLRLT